MSFLIIVMNATNVRVRRRNGVRDNDRLECRDQMEVCKVPRVESDAKLERIKLRRGEPRGGSK